MRRQQQRQRQQQRMMRSAPWGQANLPVNMVLLKVLGRFTIGIGSVSMQGGSACGRLGNDTGRVPFETVKSTKDTSHFSMYVDQLFAAPLW